MAQKLKFGGLILTLTVLAGCATQPPQERERVVPLPGQSGPAPERPAPPPVRPAEPTTVPTPAPSAPPATELPDEAGPPPAPRAALPALPPAARSLMARADRASAAGRHDEAAAQLERALRIAPRHPVLWQNLAVVRYRQRDYDKVEGLALKSNSLAAGAPALRKANWELIATVRRLKGNLRGADAAAAEARALSGAR